MAKKPAIFPRASVMAFLALLASARTLDDCLTIIERQIELFPADKPDAKSKTWRVAFATLVAALREGRAEYQIFRKGNSKLPFYAFSVVPIFTCPGRGDCESVCYSLKAWQYPSALARQVQNWLLMRFNRRLVADAFLAIPANRTVRLYVDGDFADIGDLAFWFRLLFARPDIDATYGYSKSLDLFLDWSRQGLPFPPNYRLNLSDGSRFDDSPIFDQVGDLPVVRGIFAALHLDRDYGTNEEKMTDREYHQAVREAIVAKYGKKGVSCQIKCDAGACAERHWCHHLTARNHEPTTYWPKVLTEVPSDFSGIAIAAEFVSHRGSVDYSEPTCKLADKPIIGIGIH